jgi:hypothetical protein
MAWIESHQTVWAHAKTRKAARRLGIPDVQLVGHLHALWHWALDHAEDGNVGKYDAEDLAIAARWDGEPDGFVAALVDCGPGDSAGFFERGGSYGPPEDATVGELVLHDWWQYAGKLIARRREDRDRKRAKRSADPADTPEDVQGTSGGHPADVHTPVQGTSTPPSLGHATVNQPTNQPSSNPSSDPPAGESVHESDADDPSTEQRITESFEAFWQVYPARDGKKVGRGNALIEWRKLTWEQRRRAYTGARNLAAGDSLPKDPERFLRRAKGGKGDFPFDDWQQAGAGHYADPMRVEDVRADGSRRGVM